VVLFVGDDWAQAHHDIEIQDETGRRLLRRRLPEGLAGMGELHALLAQHLPGDAEPAQVIVGIETDRGTWVAALIAAGYQVYAINPLAASRYRERHVTSGAKSDPGDAKVLADLVRTDRHNHRPVAGDSELAEAVKVLARAHQNLIWTRQRQTNALRSTLCEFYPAALTAFDDLASPDAISVPRLAPTPARGRALSLPTIADALRRGGRQRNVQTRAEQLHAASRRFTPLHAALGAPQLAARPLVTDAFGHSVTALVAVIGELVHQIEQLEVELTKSFESHPDAEILRSLPGLGLVLSARVLAEFGDDPTATPILRPARTTPGPRRLPAPQEPDESCSPASPATVGSPTPVTSGRSVPSTPYPAPRALYDTRRANGATHHQALRALANRLVGLLHGCLRHQSTYDETIAWPQPDQPAQPHAA